jgi:hypothetical protein
MPVVEDIIMPLPMEVALGVMNDRRFTCAIALFDSMPLGKI